MLYIGIQDASSITISSVPSPLLDPLHPADRQRRMLQKIFLEITYRNKHNHFQNSLMIKINHMVPFLEAR